MKITLSIQGPQAVGKTTVLRQLAHKYPTLNIVYENPQPIVRQRSELGLDISQFEGFIANQRLFIQAEIDRYNALPDGLTLFDRGPEDTLCYSLNYPLCIDQSWPVESELAMDIQALDHCLSKRILYLYARDEVLIARKQNDSTRSRRSFDLKSFKIFFDWYRKRPDTDFIDVSDLTPDQVLTAVERWLMSNSDLGV